MVPLLILCEARGSATKRAGFSQMDAWFVRLLQDALLVIAAIVRRSTPILHLPLPHNGEMKRMACTTEQEKKGEHTS